MGVMWPSHWRARSALRVTLEYAKCTLAAPAQKAQLFSTRVVREVCFGSFNATVAALFLSLCFLFGSEIQQISNLENELLRTACRCI